MYFRIELPPQPNPSAKRIGRWTKVVLVLDPAIDEEVATTDAGLEIDISRMVRFVGLSLNVKEVAAAQIEALQFRIVEQEYEPVPASEEVARAEEEAA